MSTTNEFGNSHAIPTRFPRDSKIPTPSLSLREGELGNGTRKNTHERTEMHKHTPAECQHCGNHVRPYDTESWRGEVTYAYECRCGNVWTIDAKDVNP